MIVCRNLWYTQRRDRRQQIECQCQQSINKRSNWFGLAWSKATRKSPVALACMEVEGGPSLPKSRLRIFWNVSKLLGISQSSRVALLHYAWDNVDDNDDDVWGAHNASVNFINISFFWTFWLPIEHAVRIVSAFPQRNKTLWHWSDYLSVPPLNGTHSWISTFAFPFALCHFVISTRRTFLLQHRSM